MKDKETGGLKSEKKETEDVRENREEQKAWKVFKKGYEERAEEEIRKEGRTERIKRNGKKKQTTREEKGSIGWEGREGGERVSKGGTQGRKERGWVGGRERTRASI